MECPRCQAKMQNVVEYITEHEDFIYSKEFYCTRCKSCIIEHFDKSGLIGSEWIDFNV
jgi:hypothetical protein